MKEGDLEKLQSTWDKEQRARSRKERWVLGAFVILLIIVLAALATPCGFKHLERAALAEHINNMRCAKLALDMFAMDNDGEYPNVETASFYELADSKSSNDYFRQVFAAGATQSERIFWIKDHPVCVEDQPDDLTIRGGVFSPEATLKPGDNGLAYVLHQANTSNPIRPILFDSPPTASGLIFDADLWENKVVVVRIDGSAGAMRLDQSNRLRDDDGHELLTPASKVWDGTPVDIAYPEPASP